MEPLRKVAVEQATEKIATEVMNGFEIPLERQKELLHFSCNSPTILPIISDPTSTL